MNKKNKAKRYLAGLLTVLMIFQQSGMNSILADSDEVPVTFAAEEELAGYDEVQEYEGQAQAEETVEEPVTEEVMEEEPIQPEETEEPEEPSQPEESGEPEEPSQPEESGEPEEPSQPEEPGEPEEPSQPEESGDPEETMQPEEPGDSEEPEQPEITEIPELTATPEPEQTEVPKTDFSYEDESISVTAAAEESAGLPQDAQLKVENLLNTDPQRYEGEKSEMNSLLGIDGEIFTAEYLLYDIYFWSETAGGRVEPADGSVKVQMNFTEPQLVKNTQEQIVQSNLKVYVNRQEDTAAQFDTNEAEAVQGAAFSAVNMGTAAIVRINEMKKNEQLVYTYEDSEVVVTATLAAPDAVPDEAEFRVTRVTPQTAGYNYDAYMQALNNNAEMISPDNSANGQESDVYTEKNTLLYDIAFLVDKTDENGNVIPGEKEEYQPTEGVVNISFDFKKSQLTQEVVAEKAEEIAVVHLPLDEATKESVDTTADATDISAGNINVEVVSEAEVQLETEVADFDLNNFSLVAFVNVNGQELNPGTSQNYWSILGNAIYYGVTANTINKDAHMDTNFATKYFTGSGNVTAGAYTGNNGDANNGGVYVIADMSSDSSLKIDGKNSDVWCTDAIKDRLSLEVDGKGQKTIFAKGALEVYVDRLIASVSEVSASMADEVSYQVKNQNEVMNQAEINISERPEGTYYIDGDWLNDISEGALRIKKKSDQTIVFNYKGTSVNLKRFEIWDTDRESGYMQSTTSSASADQYARTVVFNMPNATDVTFASGMFGIFLAPNATVHGLGGTSSGWLVVDTLDKNGSEWHCVWSDMPDSSHIPVPAQLTAIKTVNGDRPGDDEKFRFKLETYNKEWRNWAQVEILPNKGNFVTFTSMTFQADGQYYYRISEYGEVDGYIKDDTVYIAVITVSSDSQISGDTTITSYKIDSVKYYRASDLEEVTEDNLVPAAAFDNTRQEEEKIETSVCKEWDDADNQDGKRPQSILVQLYANGQKLGEPVVLNGGNGWSYGWSDLPVKQDGQTVVYSVKEVGRIPGYESTVTGDVQTGFVITNSHTPELTKISGEKIWDDADNQDGKRPESITVNLFANGEKIDSKAVKADAEGNWKYSFKNLPKYANGQLISYTVTEDVVPEYTTEISGTTIINQYQPGKTSISVIKAWEDGNNQDGLRPTDIKVQLYADGTPEGEEVTLNAGNQWSYTWSDLDEMKSGQKIVYTVEEAGKVTGYDTVISGEAKTGYVITNSHTPELTKISGEKIWDDGDNQDGKRPESITVNLFANGEKIDSKAVKADAEGNWKYSFKNLPKYANGQLISYTVTEDVVPEYTAEISGTTIINKYQPGKTSISVIKAWEDGNNQDGKRPADIKVQLYADGSKQGEEITLNAGNQWSYTWSGLDEMKSGQKISYTVKEAGKIAGYDTVISGEAKTGYVITNSHTPELTKISGEKIWDDGDNQDGKRPESITVNLFANGEKIDSKAVKADAEGNWKYSFKNLPKYANGQLISYTVTEDVVPEYTTEISGTTIINQYQPGKTSISVIKAWEDGNNQDGKRPADIKVQLYADGSKQGEEITLNAGNQWSYTWSGLDEMKSGQKISYTVKEVGKVTGYDTVISGEAKTGYVITNSHTPELTKISGEKIWDDANNQDGKRPESITVNLFANGEKIDSKAVKADAEGNWKYSFKNLPKYADGQLISYTVTEDVVPEYTTEISGTAIINKYQPGKTSISVIKAWEDGNNQDGKRPADIKVQLYADGSKQGEEITLNAGNQWSYTWSGLDEMKSGQKISYTVKEAGKVTGYDTVISGEAKTGYVITNSHTPELTNISGEKIWDDADNQDGKRPESITVNLFANGEKIDSKAVKADAEGNWKYSFKNLPKYADGQLISYTVTEDVVPEYTTEISGTAIINKYQPGKTSISVIKAWEDGNNQDGKRPADIKVQLYADGSKQGEEITLNAGNQWSYTWSGLDEMKSGQKISYTVKEVGKVTGYDTVISGEAKTGYVITNSHTPELTKISGEKIWDDGDNQDGKRPESITVNLFANGEKIDSKAVKADAEGNWKYSFKNLPKYADGQLISYTVTEDVVPEYTAEISGTTIINKYQPGKTSISVIKAWEDGNNQDGLRPTDIKVQLYADGSKQGEEVTLNAGNQWSYTWSGLDEMKSGQKIVYTVEEAGKIAGYDTVISGEAKTGYVITNSHTPELTKISGEKIWDDADNQDGKRPESITVNLFANGEKIDSKAVKADAEGNWKYSFKNLPKYANGQLISYTVTEDVVPEYTTEISGTTIINQYQPGKTSISVIKAWEDGNNQDGKRPADIKVQLYADGSKQGEEITLNAGNQWSYTWSDLDEMKSGQKIVYTVEEAGKVTGYDTVISGEAKTGYVITNSHTPELTKISGEKIWDDGDNQDGKRPESITVNLFANGEKIDSKAVKADAEGNWKYSFKNLPKYANGQLISYTVTEDVVPEYTTEISGTTIINQYQPGKTSISVIKAWEDGNNQDGKRPADIKVQLYADGSKQGEEITLNAGNQWSYTWSGLDEMKSGQKISYTVKEVGKVTGYDTVISGEAKTGYVITNSHTPELTKISGEKIWDDANNQDGKRPESITVNLFANGEKIDSKAVKADAEGNWKYSFKNLPKYADGQLISYTVTEDVVPEYTTEISGTAIINKYQPGKTSISVIKAWEDGNNQDGKRPADIKVQLYADGSKQGEEITLNAGNQWSYTWSGLDEMKSGQKISYTVKEAGKVTGYDTVISGEAKTGYVITNSHTPELTNISGEKIWDDADNQDGKRPESITVNLLANGQKTDSKVVKADKEGNWSYTFQNLPKYANGEPIIYTVTEDTVTDYTTEVTGTTITNKYQPGKTSITVTKAWEDFNDHNGIRPSEIKVQLYADGEAQGEEITLNAENQWTHIWTDLDERKAGELIDYTVKETENIDNYETTISGDAHTGYIITNTLKTGNLELEKLITGDLSDEKLTAEEKEALTFTITGPYDYQETVYYSDFTDGKYLLSSLPLGEYQVIEANAKIPGYVLTADYSVEEGTTEILHNETATVTITNNYETTSVKISKVDITSYEELEGAHLQIIDQEGNIVDEWDSTKTAHETTGLRTGETYILRETVAPDDYNITNDTTFELNEDGTINTEKTTTTIKDGILLVEDTMKEYSDADLTVTKRLTTNEGEEIKAVDQTFYVALYADEDCTERVSDIKPLVFQNASVSSVTFTKLEKDHTYYVGECDEEGTSYLANVTADGTLYTVEFHDGNVVEIDNPDGSKAIYFDNQFEEIPDNFYRDGKLIITKKLLRADGKVKNSSQTFYAGIFADEEYTQFAEEAEEKIVALDLAGNSKVSRSVTIALPKEGNVTLYVTEVDSAGKPVDGATGFKYEISVENAEITLNQENYQETVEITNKETTPTPTPTPKPSSTPTPTVTPVIPTSNRTQKTPGSFTGTSTRTAVKTGDTTPIDGFIALLAAAAVVTAAGAYFKRRRKAK